MSGALIFTYYKIVFTFEIFAQEQVDVVVGDQPYPYHCGQRENGRDDGSQKLHFAESWSLSSLDSHFDAREGKRTDLATRSMNTPRKD